MVKEIMYDLEGNYDYVDDYEALYQAEFGNLDHGFRDFRDYQVFHDFLETQCDDYYPSIPHRPVGQKRAYHDSNSGSDDARSKRLKVQDDRDTGWMAEYLLVDEKGEGVWQRVLSEGESKQKEYYQEAIRMYEEEKDIERDIVNFVLSRSDEEVDPDIVMMECHQYEEEEECDQVISLEEEEEDQEAIRYLEELDIPKYLVTNTYTVANSDIDIVSSDGIVFKAHTVILRQASLVHQSSLPPSMSYLGYESIKLTDDDTGHSSVLAIYLQLIYLETRPDMNLNDGLLNRRVIRLARHWKSLPALDRISREVFLGALSGFSQANPPTLFITAVGLQDPTLLGFIVSQTGQLPWAYAWSDRDRRYFTDSGAVRYHSSEVAHQHHYNFGCWPLEHYTSIPPHVVYATSELIGTTDEEVDYGLVGWELKTTLLQAHGSGNSWTDIILRDGIDMPLCRTTMDRIRHIQQYDRLGAGAEDFLFEESWWSQEIQSRPTEIQASAFDHDSTDSDVRMVCSDGALVRTHSHILAKASPAFSGMVGLHAQIDSPTVAEGPLSLGDEMSAHSTVVKALMDVLYRSELPDLRFPNLIRHLIVLADKWGIEKVPQMIKNGLSAPASYDRDFDRFLLAIGLEDYALAAKVMGPMGTVRQCYQKLLDEFPPVELNDRTVLDSALKYRNNGHMHSHRMYGLNSCQYLDFIRLPPRVAWALQRAAVMWEHEVDDGHVSSNQRLCWNQREATAEGFIRIMMPDYEISEPLFPVDGSCSFRWRDDGDLPSGDDGD